MTRLLAPLAASALLLATAACSDRSEPANVVVPADNGATEPATVPANATAVPSPSPTPTPTPARANNVLALEGLGALKVGEPVPQGSGWAERGAQIEGECRTVSSPDYPGVYAITTDGIVRRISAGQRSQVKLAEGIGVGASEADVRKWFAGFHAEPHKYEGAPAKYLTAPNAGRDGPGLRFEIGQDGRVKFIHVGLLPELGYVEGCA